MKTLKKIFGLLAVSAVVCTSANANPITPQRAKQIAAEFAGISFPKQVQRRRDVSSKQQNLPLYVFSRGENQGYVFVSGSDCLPEIIGYAESGDFDESTAAPALLAYLDHYSQMAEAAEAQGLASQVIRKAAGTRNIKPLLTSHWHQTWPYNNMCPFLPGSTKDRCVTGCVATAASQILYYWRKDMPDRTKYATPTYDGWSGNANVTVSIPSGTPMKWDLMKDSYSSSDPKEYYEAAALLNYVIGTCDYMGYNNSSGAYIWDLVDPFNRQFNMASREIRRNSGKYTQAAWENVIIENLEKGWPMEYAGYHIEENGDWSGHAIVLDGYQINGNLFHFNFGWGGQGDGYYTMAEDGVNGFGVDQALVVDIHPKKPRLSGRIVEHPDTLVSRVDNKIVVEVTNNGTLPYSGICLYCLTGTTTPSTSATASVSDKTTTIAVGETKRISFAYSPNTTSNYKIYLTDVNKNVLAKTEALPNTASKANLTLNGLQVDGLEKEVMTICGEEVEVYHIYNSAKTNIQASFTNAIDATLCCPTIKAEYCAYDEVDDKFGSTVTKSLKSTIFQPGGTGVVEYNLPFSSISSAKITDGKIYKFFLTGTASASTTTPIEMAEGQGVVYFKLMGNDMTMTEGAEPGEMVAKGHYNAQAFRGMAADSTVTCYDMTGVEGLYGQPVASNKNALFYVNASQGVAGTNIVVDGVTDVLDLTPGYNFNPKDDIKALKAVYHADYASGKFATAYLPFDCEVPTGMFARKVNAVSVSNVSECDSCNHTMLAGTPYIILSSKPVDLVANNVDVSIKSANQGAAEFCGTWSNVEGTATNWVLADEDTPYFESAKGQIVPALTAYMEFARRVRMSTSELRTKDLKTRSLAQTLISAYDVLEQYAKKASDKELKSLSALVAQAEQMLTDQPMQAVQHNMIAELEQVMAGVVRSAGILAANGYEDKTYYIANPSFEETIATKGWTRTDKNGASTATGIKSSKITTSLTTYMSGADGNNVITIAKGGYVLSQVVEGLPNGTYQLVVSVSADYGKQISIFADEQVVTVESSDFGPYYFADAIIDDVKVENGTLTIGAMSADDPIKVDNFRLYLKEADATGISLTPTSPKDRSINTGVYDLSGRKLDDAQQLKPGIYIINGKKVVKK